MVESAFGFPAIFNPTIQHFNKTSMATARAAATVPTAVFFAG
jgi:hypothetical protein